MSTIELRFACGHALALAANQIPSEVQCADCACKQITHVKAPPPRFTGSCTGPYVTAQKD